MQREKQESQARFNRRALLLGAAGAAVFAGLGARLYALQILEQDRYRTLSDDNQFNYRLQPPTRGRLLDRFDQPIAENRDSYRLMIVPEQAGDPRAALERLSRFMPMSEERIDRLVREIRRSPRFQPVTIAEDLDWETFTRINLHLPELSGITPDVGEVRTYPHPQAFAHVSGYVQSAPANQAEDDPLLLHPGFRIGRAGVEAYAEDTLRGEAGQLKVEVNAFGRVIRELPGQSVPAVPGRDVRLTVDLRAQRAAMAALDGQAAAAVAIDVTNGEILALASSPSFDPNAFVLGIAQDDFDALNTNPYRPLFNKATTGLYAPASTVKGMVALAALTEGEFDPDETVVCNGSTRLGNRTFHCWRREGHGRVNYHDAVKTSCDIYFYEAARRLGIERWRDMAIKCGMGALFDIGLQIPRRAEGLVPSPAWKRARRGAPWTTGDMYNVGIGQGDPAEHRQQNTYPYHPHASLVHISPHDNGRTKSRGRHRMIYLGQLRALIAARAHCPSRYSRPGLHRPAGRNPSASWPPARHWPSQTAPTSPAPSLSGSHTASRRQSRRRRRYHAHAIERHCRPAPLLTRRCRGAACNQ